MTGADGGLIEIANWLEVERLPGRLDQLSGSVEGIGEYAVTWVAQRSGFEPSPLCLLQPLAEVMDVVGEAFRAATSLAAGDLASVRSAAVSAGTLLRESDLAALAAFAELA